MSRTPTPPPHEAPPARRSLWPIGLTALGLLLWLIGGRVLVDAELGRVVCGTSWLALVVATALRARAGGGSAADAAQTAAEASARRWLVAASAGVALAATIALGADLAGIGGPGGASSEARLPVVVQAGWIALLALALPTLAFLERAWQAMPTPRAIDARRMRAAAEAGLVLGLSLISLFAINYTVSKRDVERDLSYFRTTAPGEATLSLLQRSEAELEALLFFGPVDHVREVTEPYFQALAAAQPKLRVRVVDQVREPELARRLKVRGNGWVVLRRAEAARDGEANAAALPAATTATAARAALDNPGESFEIGEDLERARRNLRRLDSLVHKALAKLSRPSRRLAITQGHGERSRDGEGAGSGLSAVFDLLERFAIDHENLGLADGLGQRVPEGTPAVAILGPRGPFLAEETRALLRYVEGGGRLLLLLDPNADDGLDPLLAGLGLQRLPGVVASERASMRRRYDESDRAAIYSASYSTHPTVTTASRNTGRVATVLLGAAALEEVPAAKDGAGPRLQGVRVAFPLRAPNDAWVDADGDYQRDAGEREGRLELMAAVTVPGKPAAGGAPAAAAPAEGRVVVIGDGDLVVDDLAPNPGNIVLFVDSLRWLIGDDDVAGEIASEEDVQVEHRKDEDRLWFYGTSFGLPLPLLLVGLWLGRRLRRRQRLG